MSFATASNSDAMDSSGIIASTTITVSYGFAKNTFLRTKEPAKPAPHGPGSGCRSRLMCTRREPSGDGKGMKLRVLWQEAGARAAQGPERLKRPIRGPRH